MQLYFIRHGQSENNFLWDTTGGSDGRVEDPELTGVGKLQARYLAEFLQGKAQSDNTNSKNTVMGKNIHLTHLYSSMMVRAVNTGMIVSNQLELPLIAWKDLHETGGVYLDDIETCLPVGRSGLNRDAFQKRFPAFELPGWLGGDGWWNRPFEDEVERSVRAQRFISDLLHRHGNSDDHVAVFSHAGFYNEFIRALWHIPPEIEGWFHLNNTGVTRIDFLNNHVNVVYMNRTEFLPSNMIT